VREWLHGAVGLGRVTSGYQTSATTTQRQAAQLPQRTPTTGCQACPRRTVIYFAIMLHTSVCLPT